MALRIPHLVFLPRHVAEMLRSEAARSGSTKSDVMVDAIWFLEAREHIRTIQDHLAPALDEIEHRLGKIGAQQKQSRELVDLTVELLQCVIQHQLALVGDEAATNDEAIQLGKERFGRLLDFVEGYVGSNGFVPKSGKLH